MTKKEIGVIIVGGLLLIASGLWKGWHAAVTLLVLGILVLFYLKFRFIYLGNQAYHRGELEEAVSAYRKASGLPFSGARAVLVLVQLLIRDGALDEAEEVLSSLTETKLRKNEERLSYTLLFAQLVWKRGDLQKAAETVEEIHQRGIHNSASYITLGMFYLLMKDYPKALALNEEAYRYDDTNPSILDNLGETYLALDRLDDAQAIYEKLMAEEPAFPEAFYHHGELLEQLGNKEEAVLAYQKALTKPFSEVSVISASAIEERIRMIEEQHA